MIVIALIILLSPLAGFLLNALFGKKLTPLMVGIIGNLSILSSFIFTILLFFVLKAGNFLPVSFALFNWITAANLHVSFEILIDPLTITMMGIVTGVGALIHLYSIGYMIKDKDIHSFFAYMNLFTFSMLLLVMSANYLVMFIGWEGVGFCSYLLIGFWFKNDNYNYAARKAFIMNRIGDLGFLIAMIALFFVFGTLSFSGIFPKTGSILSGDKTITIITILLLIGATGKSAQIPLYTWLPDAMAGPTPVSALIHAATMVTAGVYMIARSSALFILAPLTMEIIVIIGIATALLTAVIGLYQNDIKKILAYSTISQLGYMFLALGLGAFSASVFHLTTHAFFKALLFLGAGSVIHALGGEQDIRKMGNLKNKLTLTFITFLAGTLAISGIPPFSGFFSKDEILTEAFKNNTLLWILGLIGALLTCFYMFRLLYLVFFGKFKGTDEQKSHLHESPKSMTIPLVLLAILSILGGLINIPSLFGGKHVFGKFLDPVFAGKLSPHLPFNTELVLVMISIVLLVVIIFISYRKFVSYGYIPPADQGKKKLLIRLISNKFYVDETYDLLFVKPFGMLSSLFYGFVEKYIIDPVVDSFGNVMLWLGKYLRRLQTGNITFYVFVMIVSVILVILYNLYFN